MLPALATPLASAQRDRRRRSSTIGRSSLSLSGPQPHRLAGSGGPGEAGGSSGGVKQKEVKEVVYKTPAPHRRYKEDEEEGEGEGDSMGDIQLAPEQLQSSVGAEVGLDVLDEEEGEEESDGEVEYMPPKVHGELAFSICSSVSFGSLAAAVSEDRAERASISGMHAVADEGGSRTHVKNPTSP